MIMNSNVSRWVQACTLCYVNLINYMDRYTVSGVLEDIEDEFGMEDEWMGGLIQTAFIVCYVIAAPIFGYFGDRYSRKWLIILGILMWSSSIMASSFMPVCVLIISFNHILHLHEHIVIVYPLF